MSSSTQQLLVKGVLSGLLTIIPRMMGLIPRLFLAAKTPLVPRKVEWEWKSGNVFSELFHIIRVASLDTPMLPTVAGPWLVDAPFVQRKTLSVTKLNRSWRCCVGNPYRTARTTGSRPVAAQSFPGMVTWIRDRSIHPWMIASL